MAVDTREKRASVTNFFTPLPLPDVVAEGAPDRRQVSWVYAGALSPTPPVAPGHAREVYYQRPIPLAKYGGVRGTSRVVGLVTGHPSFDGAVRGVTASRARDINGHPSHHGGALGTSSLVGSVTGRIGFSRPLRHYPLLVEGSASGHYGLNGAVKGESTIAMVRIDGAAMIDWSGWREEQEAMMLLLME